MKVKSFRSPPVLTCELKAQEKWKHTRRALTIHQGKPVVAPEARPGRPRTPAPCQGQNEQAPQFFPQRGPNPSLWEGEQQSQPVTHPAPAGAAAQE